MAAETRCNPLMNAVAEALANWSSAGAKPWEERHPKNRKHWLCIAQAVLSNEDAITGPVLAYAHALKRGEDPRAAIAAYEGRDEPRNHAPWCSFVHVGPCPAENEAEAMRRGEIPMPMVPGRDGPTAEAAELEEGQDGELERLLSNEGKVALLAARSALARGESPDPNTVGVLVLELQRLVVYEEGRDGEALMCGPCGRDWNLRDECNTPNECTGPYPVPPDMTGGT